MLYTASGLVSDSFRAWVELLGVQQGLQYIVSQLLLISTVIYLPQMKKAQSMSSLKFPLLEASCKKSLQLDSQPSGPRLTVTRSSKNLATTRPLKISYNYNDLLDTDATSNDNTSCLVKPAAILRNKVSTLHSAIEKLEKQISESKESGKNKSKDYDGELKKYQQIANSITICENAIKSQQQKLNTFGQRLQMLNEDFTSRQMNVQQALAQKEYCDEVIEQYRREFESEAAVVLEMLSKQAEGKRIKQEIEENQKQLQHKQRSLQQWKNQVQYSLQQKVTKNKLTQLRIDLLKAQQQANTLANKQELMKIREILCTMMKTNNNNNSKIIDWDGEEGIEIYLCEKARLEEFENAVRCYRGERKVRYDSGVVEKYFAILRKIESVVNNSKLKLHRKICKQFSQQIATLRAAIIEMQQKLVINAKKVTELQQKIELILAQESVAIIQNLREKKGRYELSEIKSTLRTLKQEQTNRINKVKNVHRMFLELKNSQFDTGTINYMNSREQLKKQQQLEADRLRDLRINLRNLQQIKNEVENCISLAVSRWGELSCKKEQLKQLYRDLNQLNKQVREAELARFQQKGVKTVSKWGDTLFRSGNRSQTLAKNMRQTLKLKINGNCYKNKQNEARVNTKNHQKTNKLNQKMSNWIQQNCRTRKPSISIVEQKDKDKKAEQTLRKLGHDSLTAVLFSKLIN